MCERKNLTNAEDVAPIAFIGHFAAKRTYEARSPTDQTGSRRKRLWDLASHTHCPVIGVCLPMPVLRRLIGKALGSHIAANDYEFHAAAVAECASRRPVSEILQRELDRRYAVPIKRFAQAKASDDLANLWRSALRGPDIAGALWATLSHARCSAALCEQVCHDIHMFQHQVGACNRADLQRLEQLQEENILLATELATFRERQARMLNDRNDELDRLNSQLMRLRGKLIARESEVTALQEEIQKLHCAASALPQRVELARRLGEQQERNQQLMQERTHLQQRAEQEAARAEGLARQNAALIATLSKPKPEKSDALLAGVLALQDKAVLCVGGRSASVPVYRQVIERTGGTFLHHDGGEEQSSGQLESSLAAADLVICQTGCISHHAYWRVKDYCKRTGKQCVFVEKPSTTSFVRCLHQFSKLASPAVNHQNHEENTQT